MQHAPDRPDGELITVLGHRCGEAGIAPKGDPPLPRPAAADARPVQLPRLALSFAEERIERDVTQILQLGDHLLPAATDGRLEVLEHDALGHAVERHEATGREQREVLAHLALQVGDARRWQQRPQAPVEPELLVLVADEVEHREARLGVGAAKATAELLQEHCGALGGAKKQHRVDVGQVETLVE